MAHRLSRIIVTVLVFLMVTVSLAQGTPTRTATTNPTLTVTSTLKNSIAANAITLIPTATRTGIQTSTPLANQSPTATTTTTPSVTFTATITPGPSQTFTPSPTRTPLPSFTPVQQIPATPTSTFTPSFTPSPTPTSTVAAPVVSGGTCSSTVAAGDITGFVNAINAANANQNVDTICLTSGTPYTFATVMGSVNAYPFVLPVISSPIIIEGNNAVLTRSNPGNFFTLFYVDVGGNLTLKNVSLSNWRVNDNNQYQHTIETVVVNGQATLDNVLSTAGWRVVSVAETGSLTVRNSVFMSNFNIAIYNLGTTSISGSTFRGNLALEAGPLLYNTGTLNIDGSVFTSTARTALSVIYNRNNLNVTNSSFIENNTKAISSILGTAVISSSVFRGNVFVPDNSNNAGGAAVDTLIGNVTISNSCIVGNIGLSAVYDQDLTTPVDARNNWWGSAQGPNQPGSDKTNVVLYQPFLTAPILGCPLPPLKVTDQTLSTTLNTAINVTLSASGGALPYSFSTSSLAHGTLTGTAPNFVYTPNNGFTGLETFTYTLTDGAAQSATATIRIYVNQPIASNIIVNSTAQEVPPVTNGNCTLGEAIRAANTNLAVDGCVAGTTATDIIQLQAGTYTLTKVDNVTLNGANALPVVTDNLIIRGSNAIIERNSVTSFRFIETTSTTSLTLVNLTMRGGSSGGFAGGAVYAKGSLSIGNSTFTNNQSNDGGGALAAPSMVVDGSTFNNNYAYSIGGAISTGLLTLTNSQFTDNYVTHSTAGSGGAVYSGPITLTNTTFTRNSARLGGALTIATTDKVISNITNATFDSNGSLLSSGASMNVSSTFAVVNMSNSVIKNSRGITAISVTTTTTITNSCITGNAGSVYDNVNLPNNWWGAVDGPSGDYAGGGDKLTKYASYNPPTVTSWLTAPPAGCDVLAPTANNQSVATLYQQPKNITLTGKGGMPPYTYAVVYNPSNGTLSGTAPNLVYTPNAGFKGSDAFSFKVINSTGQISNVGTVLIYIVTDLQATYQNLLTAYNTPINFTLGATGGTAPYTFSEITPVGSSGILAGTAPNFTYMPYTGFIGSQRFNFKVTDAAGYVSVAAVIIQVASPLETSSQLYYAPPLAPIYVPLMSYGGVPPLTYTLKQAPTSGVLTGTLPSLIYRANADANGIDTFKYDITDASGATVTTTITLYSGTMVTPNSATVYTPLNTPIDLPIFATSGTQPYTITVFDNTVLPNAPYTYTPVTGFTGTYQVDYSVQDALGFVSYGKITVKVGIQPLTLQSQVLTTAYQTPVNFILSATGGAMPYTFTVGTAAHGTITGTAPANLTYTPANGYSGTENVTISVQDNVGATQSATVTFTVYPPGTVNDANSLIAAINAANANPGPDTINLSSGTLTLTNIHNTSANGPNALPVITDTLTISGIATLKRDANAPEFRFFEVATGVSLTLDGLTLDNGSVSNAAGNSGGSVYNAGTLSLTNVIMRNNTAYSGGALFNANTLSVSNTTFLKNSANYGGAIYNLGILTLTNSLLQTNTAFISGSGGAITTTSTSTSTITNTTFTSNTASAGQTYYFGGGGAIHNYGMMTVTGSNFLSNTAGSGYGGAIRNEASLSVNMTTFANNAAADGGGILSDGGSLQASLAVTNSTFSGNRGAIYATHTSLSVINSTFSGNTTPSSEGSAIGPGHVSAPWIVRFNTFTLNGANTIAVGSMQFFGNILTNNSGNNCSSLAGQDSKGYNVLDDASCGLNSANDRPNASITVGPLAGNGGPTDTHMPLAGSIAIDLIPLADCTEAADQRGVSRPVGVGCDAGAVERDAVSTPPIVTNINSVADTGNGSISEGELIQASLTQLLVTFDRSVQDPAGNNQLIDVTNPASYRLIKAGVDNVLQTTTCSALAGDDTSVAINSVSYNNAARTATLSVNGGVALPQTGFYKLLVCASGISGTDNRQLDGNGDGVSGDDFSRIFTTNTSQFRADLAVTVVDSPDPVVLNQTLTYTITVSNAGPQAAQNVTLTDVLPDVTFVSASDAACTRSGQTVSCNLGIINPSSSKVITISTTVNGTTFRALTNTASATNNVIDPNAANNTNIQTLTNANEAAQVNLAVNTTSMVDDGVCGVTHCSLPEAINAANTRSGADTITFNLPGSGPYILKPLGALPTVAGSTTLDGRSQPGYTNKPIVTISGEATNASGLLLSGDNNVVQGLIFVNFKGYSLSINAGSSNKIGGNYIGTDGLADKGDAYGIQIINGAGNIIGGITPTDRNIISGNYYGIHLSGANGGGNVIQGNYIGTDVTGKLSIPNAEGIHIQSNNATIGGMNGVTLGGACTGACNLISANQQGILIAMGYGQNTTIQGNFIGTDVTGKLALGNTTSGIYGEGHSELSGLLIGGALVTARNLISANGVNGVYTGGANSSISPRIITVQNNYVGLDTTGTIALGNGQYGLRLLTDDNVVIGNVVSDNQLYGIQLSGGASTLYGNLVGTNASGTALLGNQATGMALIAINGTIVGGAAPGQGNVIAGTSLMAMQVSGQKVTIQGNHIGTDATGAIPLGNSGDGIFLTVSNIVIGGVNPSEGNTIANNQGNGISVGYVNDSVRIQGNSIFANGGLGIDLITSGNPPITSKITPNDVGDVQAPQNFPVLTSAITDTSTVITGSLNSQPNKMYQIEFFANDTCDAANYGEGQTILNRLITTTDSNGNVSFTVTSPILVPPGKWITATATSPSNNTSEFSACIRVLNSGLMPDTYQETNEAIVYTGNWNNYAANGPAGGSSKYTNDPTAKVSIPVANDVERATIYHTQNTVYGAMDVYQITGATETKLATIPGTGALVWDVPFSVSLPNGSNRVLELRNTSSKFIGLEAIDLHGPVAPLHVGNYQENDPEFVYSGNWINFVGTGPREGAYKYSNDSTAKFSFRIDSTVGRITFYRTTYSLYGTNEIYLDGAATPIVNMNNSSPTMVFGVPFTLTVSPGNHTIELRNVGSNYSSIDEIDLLPPAVPLTINNSYQESDSNLSYSGNWLSNSTTSALGNARKYTNDPNATVSFKIDNSVGRVTIYRTTYLAGVYGSMQVFLDGAATPLTTINNVSSAFLFQQPFTFAVTPGSHLITLKNVGSTYSDLDQITLEAPPAALGIGDYPETDSNLTYSGTWTQNTTSSAIGNGRKYTNDPNGSVSFNITNAVGRVTIYRTTYVAGAYGSMQVFLDGAATPFTTINNTSSAFLFQQPFTFAVTPGSHTITLKNVGSTYSDIDQITLQAPTTPLTIGDYQEDESRLIYNGAWTVNNTSSALGNGRKYTNDPNASVSFTIDNTVGRVTIYRTTYLAGVYGSMQVFLDNSPVALTTINNVSSTFLFQQPMTFTVPAGNHIITLKNVGSTYSDLDQITLQAPTTPLGVGDYQETDSNLTYSGIWTQNTTSSAISNGRKYTNDPNGTVSFNITNAVGRVTIYRTTYVAGAYGAMQVFLDGAAAPFITINNTSSTFLFQQSFTFAVIPGSHTITLKNVGSTYSDIDQITLGAASTPLNVGNYQETEGRLIYNGIWTQNTTSAALGNGRKYTNDPFASVSFTIDNSVGVVTIYRTTYVAAAYGSMQVFLDNNPTALTTINNVSSTFLFQQPFTFNVTPGSHIITLKNVGSTYSDLDQITLAPQGSMSQPVQPTVTLTPTVVTVTPTLVPTEATLTETPIASETPVETLIPTQEVTAEPTQTAVPTEILSNTPVPSVVPTDMPSPTPVPTSTVMPSEIPSNTPAPTVVPTNTAIQTEIPSNTPVPSETLASA